jgi:hypothetical protein
MYHTCLFCHRPLGTNAIIEPLPVGRRVAYDSDRGRVWVVCAGCHRWNLTPLEDRWEILEACERLYSSTSRRFSTDNIGLGRLPDGTDLVRIGSPRPLEFAAWRYGRRFELRRRHAVLAGTAAALAAAGATVLIGGAAMAGFADAAMWVRLGEGRRVVAELERADGFRMVVRKCHLPHVRLATTVGAPGWVLHLRHAGGIDVLRGPEAMAALWTLMPRVNPAGGSRHTVERAVREIDDVGGPDPYIRVVSAGARSSRGGNLEALPRPTRLALEMAVHEETERRALQGELSALESAWRQAEEIAAIADDLLLPESVHARLTQLRR